MGEQTRLRTSTPRAKSTVALVTRFIEDESDRDIYFLRSTGRLKIIPCARRRAIRSKNGSVSDIVIRESGYEDKILRIRNNPNPTLKGRGIDDPYKRLEVGAGPRWLPLSAWLHCHYDDFRINIEADEDFHPYRLLKSYFHRRRRTDFTFWRRFRDLKFTQTLVDSASSWRCTISSTSELIFEVEVRLKRSGVQPVISPALSDLEVKSSEDWQPFLEWEASALEMLEIYGDSLIEQLAWWADNGMVFQLMDLPLELRETIYDQITGPYLWPHTARIQPVQLGQTYTRSNLEPIRMFDPTMVDWRDPIWKRLIGSSQFHLDPSGNRPPPFTSIIGTNTQIKSEFCNNAYRNATMHFQDDFNLHLAICSPQISCHIRSISIGFPNSSLFNFVGFVQHHHQPFVPMDRIPVKILCQLKTLEHIEFHFQVTPPRLPNGMPCLDPFLRQVLMNNMTDVTCQKVLVDWFLTLALAYIRHIPHISISGHVKNSTRADWEAIFEDERQGIEHDMSAQVQNILSLHWTNFPILCACQHPCDWWKQRGPYPEGERDPNFDPMPQPSHIDYEPRKHDRFNYEG
ncbi:hypothetical protein HBI79_169570 [Parastagonospora nodorum]|nr:hypothetical protein HBI79_169570 [Parastagonospora nodorum]KAH5409944.1 hypothetical protein HBI47_165400 [Parastagonospora nodorum]